MTLSLQGLKKDPVANLYKILVFLFPLGAAFIQHWATVFFYALLALSLFTCCRKGFLVRSTGDKSIFWGYGIFFAAALASLVNADDLSQGFARIDPLLGFLFFILMFLGIRKAGADVLGPYIKGLAVAGLILFCAALYTTEIQSLPRARGYYNAIVFGDIAIFIALTGFSFACFNGFVSRVWQWVIFLSIPLALYASFLAGSRGGWLAVLAVIPVIAYLLTKNGQGRKGIVVLVLGFSFAFSSPFIFADTIGFQLERTAESMESFFSAEDKNTSTGQRFLMWSVAIDIWKDNPILGSGLGDFRHDVTRRMKQNETELSIAHVHAHNIFYEYLATTGLVGFVSMILGLFVVPFRFFIKALRKDQARQMIFAGAAGIVALVSFAVFGLTENWLGRSALVKSFLVAILIFTSTISSEKNNA